MKLSILFLITFLNLWNVSIAQSLKIYSGKYREGTATYSYKDNPEGGRIYEGDFVYTAPYCKVTGQFKNNKKNGLWIYEGYKESLKLSYKDGVLDGMYQFINGGDNACTLLLTIKDGKFVGSAKGTDIGYTWHRLFHSRGSFSGQFDESGYMDGDWTFKDDDGIYVFHATYEHGVCQKCYREDITTGDIVEGAVKIDLHSIIIDNFETIEGEVDRGHSRWNRYDYEIEKKSVEELPRPTYDDPNIVKVVVDVIIDPAGNVIAASINPQTNTTNSELHEAGIYHAKRIRFKATGSKENRVETVTVRIL